MRRFFLIATLLAVSLILFWGLPTSVLAGTTVTYNIPVGSLVNQAYTCASNSYYNGCSTVQPGFTWTSTGSGSVTALSIQINVGVDCHGSGTSRTTTLNGIASESFSSIGWCNCSARDNIYTINPPLASYNVGGSNTFLMTNPTTCLGQSTNTTWPAGTYARVTVTYGDLTPRPGGVGISGDGFLEF